MDFEERLNEIADQYRAQGYKVVVRPGLDALPPFAKDFRIEILAERPGGHVLATVKETHAEFEADTDLGRYAEAIDERPGWRYDLHVLGPGPRPPATKRDAKEPSEDEIGATMEDAERLLQAGFVRPALVSAWAALEAALRRRRMAEGKKAGWGSDAMSTLTELYSNGPLPESVYRELEGLFCARTAIVHGFTIPAIPVGAVRFVVEAARGFLEESRAAKEVRRTVA
jgi:REase_AHJR-like